MRVGPGTPMGELIRRTWLPFCLSEELPGVDCDPVRVRLMHEDLVAFRDTAGRVGVMGEHCPHRNASLFYGRNEDGGLRCLYHGWKIDVDGTILETPCEPAGSRIRFHIRHTAYPVVEQGDVVWIYMGPSDKRRFRSSGGPSYPPRTAPSGSSTTPATTSSRSRARSSTSMAMCCTPATSC